MYNIIADAHLSLGSGRCIYFPLKSVNSVSQLISWGYLVDHLINSPMKKNISDNQ